MTPQQSDSSQSSYRQIFKATSLFGGVQVFNILIGIIRTKFVAVLLGTAGVGIMGLLNAPLQLIMSITGLGIAFSAVRDVSEAHGSGDHGRIAKAIITLRRWSWFTGLLGAVITISLAPWLSQWTFGNSDYTWAFVWLSITLLMQAISKGQGAILQGTRRLKDMAKVGVVGSAVGLITSIPLYYWFGIKGIVPAMIISAITGLFLSWHFSRKIEIENVPISFKETYTSGIGMAKLGISMTIAGFVVSLSTYVLNTFIRNKGGIEQVGLYNAGWSLIGQYTGLVFTAMATDYYPRLAAVNTDISKVKELVKQQAETALYIMTPLLVILIITMPFVVRLLYSPQFLSMVMFANLTVLGMQFKGISWAMGYVYLAKGDGKLFLITELISGLFFLMVNLIGFHFYGLNGLGVSFVINYSLGAVFTYFILNWKYSFSLPATFYRIFAVTYIIVASSFLTIYIGSNIYKYSAGLIILTIAALYSLNELNKIIDIKSAVKSIVDKKFGRN